MKQDALDKMTVKDLRELASKKKIAGAARLTKTQLVKSLASDTASKATTSKTAKKASPTTKKKSAASVSVKTTTKKSAAKSSSNSTKTTAAKTKSTKTAEKKVKTASATSAKGSAKKPAKTKATATKKKSTKSTVSAKPKSTKVAVKKITTPKKSTATKPSTGTSTRTRKRLSSTSPKRKSPALPIPAPDALSASSMRITSAPAPVHSPAPPVVKGADPGLPIPEHYGRDRLVLMVQDPHHVFAYWELQSDTVARVTNESHGGDPVLIIYINGNPQTREIDLRGGNYYLAVAADQEYEAELALRDPDGNLHLIVRSNKVRTPAPNVSSRVDEQWMGVDESFHELLELAGLPGTVAGAGSVARLRDQQLAAWGWQQDKLPSLSSASLSSHSLSSRSRLVKKP